jgi:hypothetical protein
MMMKKIIVAVMHEDEFDNYMMNYGRNYYDSIYVEYERPHAFYMEGSEEDISELLQLMDDFVEEVKEVEV